jgi:VanZ family protein
MRRSERRSAARGALRYAAPLALMALIFYLSAQQQVGPELPAFTRIVAHFSLYALLAALWVWALAPALGRRALLVAAAISLLYGVSDEYHQSFVPGRDPSLFDIVVDAAGVAVALVVLRHRQSSRRAE